MSRQRAVVVLFVLTGLVAAARSAGAQQEDVVSHIPGSALGYLVIDDLQRASDEIDKAAGLMQLPPPQLLKTAKLGLGLAQGVVDRGDAAAAVLASPQGAPQPVVLVRTDNYRQLLSQLQQGEEKDSISEIQIADKPMLMARKGGYAVVTEPRFRDGLKQVLAAEKSVASDEQVEKFSDGAALHLVITGSGVKLLTQQGIAGLQMVKQQMKQAGPQGDTVAAGLGLYEQLFQWAGKEVSRVVLALRTADNGAVTLAKQVQLRQAASNPPEQPAGSVVEQLRTLPGWPAAVTVAASLEGAGAPGQWMELSMQMMGAMAGGEGLDEQQARQLLEASKKSMQGVRGMAFMFGVPKAGGSIYSRMGMVIQTDGSAKYIDNYLDSMKAMKQVLDKLEGMPYRFLSAEKAVLRGADGMKIEMQIDYTGMLGPNAAPLKDMLDKLYGPGGKIAIYAAPVDAKRVALAYVSQTNLQEIVQAAKSAGDGPGAADTAQLLPPGAQVVGFISPRGILQYGQWTIDTVVPAQAQAPQIPVFPESPPLGFSWQFDGRAMDVRLVAPASTLGAIGQYIQLVAQAAQR